MSAKVDRGHWMQTRSGRKIYVREPVPDDICITDIVWGLAHVCRFGGQSDFYTVAQHSVFVSDCVKMFGGSRAEQLHGLLHDASEAYIGDVIWPLKQAPEMAGYKTLEARFELAIAERFGLAPWMPPIVKRADLVMLATEKRDIMGEDTSIERQRSVALEAAAAADKLGWECADIEPLSARITPWAPAMARDVFMKRWATFSDLVQG